MKSIFLDAENKKSKFYISDFCIKDPKILSKKTLLEFKKNVATNYHWDNDKKVKKDYLFLNRFIKRKTIEFSRNLNKFHGLRNNEKYWKIIIFPWLVTITYILFDRWEIIKSLKKKNVFINAYNYNEIKQVPNQFSDIVFHDKNLNSYIFTKILEYYKKIKFKKNAFCNYNINYKNSKKSLLTNNSFTFTDIFRNNDYLNNLLSIIFKFFSFFFKSNYFLKGLAIKQINHIKLNLFLRQFPFIWIEPTYKLSNINILKRKNFFLKNKRSQSKNFENFFNSIIFALMPKSFLEDYDSIKKSLFKSYWPKKCKSIVTAYDYKKNDVFQIWCAEMVKKKAKYFIMQHGGNFGSSEYEIEEDMQLNVADRFLTWGWIGKSKNIKSFQAFQLNLIKKTKLLNNKEILICFHTHQKYSYRISSLPKTNFDRLKKIFQLQTFTKNLDKKLPVCLRYQKHLYEDIDLEFNKKYFENISYDYSKNYINKILNYAKIVVHDNDTTTFLESMFLNVPTILILDKKIEKFRKSATKYYKELEKNNILFYDPIEASNFINKNYDKLDIWWNGKNLQGARNKFCHKFIKKNSEPFKELKKIIS